MSQNKVAELCCIVNGEQKCSRCNELICVDHSKSYMERMPCRCGSCNDTEEVFYCLPCVEIHKPEDYNND